MFRESRFEKAMTTLTEKTRSSPLQAGEFHGTPEQVDIVPAVAAGKWREPLAGEEGSRSIDQRFPKGGFLRALPGGGLYGEPLVLAGGGYDAYS
jgi:hypothetical protein